MAEWDPYSYPDGGDECDSDGIGGGGLLLADGSDGSSNDCTTILARLAETATTGAMFERKAAARGMLEAFRQIYFAEQDVGGVIGVIEKLVDDVEQSVRTEVMDQMPQIALFCHEESPRLDFVVPQHILPHIVRSLTDRFTQVRQASQSGLLILLERGIIASSQVAECVLPVIFDYTQEFAPEDLRAEMTAFMIKLAPLAGKEITVNSYLDLFCRLCDDSLFQVRRVCATGMGDLANVIGTRLTEVVILPKFLTLCKDTVWGVRKGCAEVFTVVSTVSQLVTRKKTLAPAFVSLLQDSSRWVRISAYQTLGPFITTFAADDSTTCTQESSEIEQAFLDRFTALHTKETAEEEESTTQTGENYLKNLVKSILNSSELPADTIIDTSCVPPVKNNAEPTTVENVTTDVPVEDVSNDSSSVTNLSDIHPPNPEDANAKTTEELSGRTENVHDETTQESEAEGQTSPVEQESSDLTASQMLPEIQTAGVASEANITPDLYDAQDTQTVVVVVEPENNEENTDANESTEVIGSVEQSESTSAASISAHEDTSMEQDTLEKELVVNESEVCTKEPQEDAEGETTESSNNQLEEPMETDELFDGEDEAEKPDGVSDTGDYTGTHDSNDCVSGIQTDNPDDVNGGSIADVNRVHRSYLNLYNASRDQNGADDSNRMPSVRLMDPYDDDDWDPENIFPYGEDLSSVWGGKGCRPRLLEDIPKSLTVQQQDVVPVDLLEHYTSMCEPMKNQAIDNALTGFCAYNLPAVVLTLGPQNWSILRECYESLACSMQWKIRYTLASSLHEIARVIGPELAERDLVPFFNALVKDVDEVRVGLLRNLASFVKILGTVERRKCLESLRSFLEPDNKRNWRFRLELTRQLEQLTEIYEADEIYKYLRPLAVDLVKDGVAEVRKTALFVITNLILRVRCTLGCGEPNLVHDFLRELVETLCQSEKWVRRQTFAALSGQLIGVGALKPVQFAEDVLPHLVNLSYDPVPNVRLIVAQTMVSCVSKLEFDERCNQLVTNIIETLQFDTDRDVRYFSSLYEAQKG